MPEITTEVLVQLAERVMGWTVEHIKSTSPLAKDWTLAHADTGQPFQLEGHAEYEHWSPEADIKQAFALLEKCCDGKSSTYSVRKHANGSYRCQIFIPSRWLSTVAETKELAITLAVCKAVGIEVQDATNR